MGRYVMMDLDLFKMPFLLNRGNKGDFPLSFKHALCQWITIQEVGLIFLMVWLALYSSLKDK